MAIIKYLVFSFFLVLSSYSQSTAISDSMGLFTVDGSLITLQDSSWTWPDSVYTPISASIPSSPFTTISVSSTKASYSLTLQSETIISNNLSSLSFQNQKADWEVSIDFSTTQALYSSFASNIFWIDGTPELSCTGTYRFVMTSWDGQTVMARQTYPTVYEWHYLSSPISAMTVGSWYQYTAATNGAYFYNPLRGSKLVLDYDIFVVSGTGTNNYLAVTCPRSDTALASATASCRTNQVILSTINTYYSFKPCLLVPSQEDHVVAIWQLGVAQTRLPLARLGIKKANELESVTPPDGWK